MSLDKGIRYGKEHRKPYYRSKRIDKTCRNHGSCPFCISNRLHKFRDRHPETLDEAIEEMTELHERSCPDCGNNLYIVRTDAIGARIYICANCGTKMYVEEENVDGIK